MIVDQDDGKYRDVHGMPGRERIIRRVFYKKFDLGTEPAGTVAADQKFQKAVTDSKADKCTAGDHNTISSGLFHDDEKCAITKDHDRVTERSEHRKELVPERRSGHGLQKIQNIKIHTLNR